jgi:hypothetical protein
LIYRVVGESSEWVWSEESGAMEISLSPGRLMGAFNAGVADGAWGDLPMPMLSNPRVRFWFTERGWRAYGRPRILVMTILTRLVFAWFHQPGTRAYPVFSRTPGTVSHRPSTGPARR